MTIRRMAQLQYSGVMESLKDDTSNDGPQYNDVPYHKLISEVESNIDHEATLSKVPGPPPLRNAAPAPPPPSAPRVVSAGGQKAKPGGALPPPPPPLPPPPPPPKPMKGGMGDLMAAITAGKKLKSVQAREKAAPPPMTSIMDAIKQGQVNLRSVSQEELSSSRAPSTPQGGMMGDLFAAIAKRRENIESTENESSDDEWDDGDTFNDDSPLRPTQRPSMSMSTSAKRITFVQHMEQTVAACEHPDYVKFFQLLAKGVPDGVVKLKAEQAGLKASYLDDPNIRVPLTSIFSGVH